MSRCSSLKILLVSVLLMGCEPTPRPNGWSTPLAKQWASQLGAPNAPVTCIEYPDNGLYVARATCSVNIDNHVYSIHCWNNNCQQDQ